MSRFEKYILLGIPNFESVNLANWKLLNGGHLKNMYQCGIYKLGMPRIENKTMETHKSDKP